MKYYIIAGEPSGDIHGANLMSHISSLDPKAEFRYWGGDKMNQQDNGLAMHIRDTAFMGFVEVIRNIAKIRHLFSFAKADIKTFAPDSIILIDYPGFNLRIAKWLKNQGLTVIYYITPQVWAWKENRVKTIDKYCDKIITVIPFEPKFFKERGIEVEYVGHPLIDEIEKYQNKSDIEERKGLSIALLPGSRKQEVNAMLSIMLDAASMVNPLRINIAKVSNVSEDIYRNAILDSRIPESVVSISENKTYDILRKSDVAVVSSGTATLETALFNVPQVVCYKVNPISYRIAKILVKLDYISLVNIILNKSVIPELIQQDCNPESIAKALKKVIIERDEIIANYHKLRDELGTVGASLRAAHIVVKVTSSFSVS